MFMSKERPLYLHLQPRIWLSSRGGMKICLHVTQWAPICFCMLSTVQMLMVSKVLKNNTFIEQEHIYMIKKRQ